MKNINERFLCLWFIAYMSLFCLPAHAAGEALREFVYRGLEQARQQINDGNYQQAHESLAKWQKRSGLKSYERAQIWNLTAFLYYNESELPQAILYYQKVLDEAEAPISLKQSTMRTLAQLYYAEENYRQAIKFIDQLGQDQIINSPDLLEVKVYSLYQLELYPETLKSLDILLSSFSSRIPGKQENWLNLKQSCYLALSDYESALKVVKKLSEKFPKTRYLRSLAALYSQTGRSREQLAVLEGLYTAGYLVDEADLDLLVVLYLKHGLPERSAGLLLTQFKAEMLKPTEKRERQLVNSLIAARDIDGAIERLDRLLKREFSAEWLALKVRLLAKQNEWQVLVDTYEMIKSGESGGSQEFAEDIKLLYAVALFNTTRFADAQIVLSELARNPKYTEQAQQWLSYVRTQLKSN